MGEQGKRSVGRTIWNAISLVICILLACILLINCILIVKSAINKDKVPSIAGWYPMIVLSDSMYPEIQKGDLIFGRVVSPEKVQVGDVISFFDPESKTGAVVTHRVTDITMDGGLSFTTKGDANSIKDSEQIPADKVIGVYKTRIRGAGKIAMFMQTTTGFIVCIALPVLLIVGYDFLTRHKKEKTPEVDEEKEKLMAELQALREEKARRESASETSEASGGSDEKESIKPDNDNG